MATVTSSKRQLTHTSNTYESNGDVTIGGNLNINGTTTTIDTANLLVEDKNIIIGDVSSPSDSTADGGGITLKGASDKTINWVNSTDSWTSNQTFSAPRLTLTGLSNQSSEATALVVNGSNVVGYRELGSNAFNSTSFLTSYTETDTLATVTARGNTTSQAITISNQLSTTNTIFARKDNISDYTNAQVRLDSFGGSSSLAGLGFHISGSIGRMLFMNSSGDLFWNSTSSKIWHAGNDGTGTGLDADLLDGNHASAFATASHSHAASDITSGTLDTARIPSLAASKITSGTLSTDRIPDTLELGDTDSTAQGILKLSAYVANKESILQTTNGNLHIDSASGHQTYINYYTGSGVTFGNGNTGASGASISTGGIIYATGGNSTNWNTAYTDRNKWDGGSTGLNASTGRTSLGLGSAATSNTSAFAAAGDENIIDGATSIWNADGDGDVFTYNDSNPIHNSKSTGAVIYIRGDGTNDHSLVRAGIFTSDHISTANGYYVGTLLGTGNSTTTQVINSSGAWTGSVIPAAKLSTATTQSSSDNSTKIATTAYVKSQGYTANTGTLTSVGLSVGTGLDGGGTVSGSSGSFNTISLDLSELTDMTGAINTSEDELILLDNGAERRKRFSEIFGSNAYNSTTIPTNNNQLTNGASYITGNQTITLSGDVSGSGTTSISVTVNDDSHNHHRLDSTDDRDVKPNTTGIGASGVQAIKPFFTTFNGMTGSSGGAYQDMIALDTYSDSSGGGPSAMTFSKSASVGSPQMYIWKGAYGGTTWGTGQRVFADNYHPNADTLTTARTIALGGDVTGSASFNGGSNITISASLSSGSVGASEIAANAVGSSEIATNAVTSAKIAADAVGASEIAASAVGASELNVSGNGSTSQFLRSDGDGTFTWATPTDTNTNTTYSAGRGLDLSGTEFQLETDLRDSISYIGYDSNDYIQWSNNSYVRAVVSGSERFRVNSAGIDVNGTVIGSGFQTDTTNTAYNLITRNSTSTTLYVQAAQSNSLQTIASFRYGSATANQGTETFRIRKSDVNVFGANFTVGGSITGNSKNFSIPHPTKEGKRLVHSCLEGPEIGVYFRGRSTSATIEMPDYWDGLVHLDSMTVELTAIGPNQDLYVANIADDGDVTIASNTETPLNYFYVVYGERKDLERLEVEINDTVEVEESSDNSEEP